MKNITTNINRLVRPRFDTQEYITWLREQQTKNSPATEEQVRDYLHETGSKNAVRHMSLYQSMATIIREEQSDVTR